MRVRVLFFGMLRELMGRGSEEVELPLEATVEDLLAWCRRESPRLAEWEASLAFAVNQDFAARSTRLKEGDEVALLPPVSGG